jgi:hypothetical protein
MENNPIELCVICGKETPYRFNDHIDFRTGYVEGAGQGCYRPAMCSNERSRKLITISEQTIYETPNDQELGEKVRVIYFNNQNK